VRYASTSKLPGQPKLSKAKDTNIADLKRIERTDLLILDDFGLQPFDAQARVTLPDIMEDRHGKMSTLIASQIPVKEWYDIIGEKTIADALSDRIVHQSLRVGLHGESLRRKKTEQDCLYL
jgi:DNA replication protein DnaC